MPPTFCLREATCISQNEKATKSTNDANRKDARLNNYRVLSNTLFNFRDQFMSNKTCFETLSLSVLDTLVANRLIAFEECRGPGMQPIFLHVFQGIPRGIVTLTIPGEAHWCHAYDIWFHMLAAMSCRVLQNAFSNNRRQELEQDAFSQQSSPRIPIKCHFQVLCWKFHKHALCDKYPWEIELMSAGQSLPYLCLIG